MQSFLRSPVAPSTRRRAARKARRSEADIPGHSKNSRPRPRTQPQQTNGLQPSPERIEEAVGRHVSGKAGKLEVQRRLSTSIDVALERNENYGSKNSEGRRSKEAVLHEEHDVRSRLLR